MPESMYEQYVKEREPNARVLEWKDRGFAKYIIQPLEQECYISEIYVVPAFRKTGIAEGMANEIAAIAREEGCTLLTGTVSVGANGDTDSLRVLLAYGMRLDSVRGNVIIFSKKLGG